MFLSSPDGGMEDLIMIDFDEEIKKFQPSQEVDEAEDAIYGNNTVDVTDIIKMKAFQYRVQHFIRCGIHRLRRRHLHGFLRKMMVSGFRTSRYIPESQQPSGKGAWRSFVLMCM